MEPDPLERLLSDYARRPLPPTPVAIRSGVHAEIARRRERSFWKRWFDLFEREFLPRPVLAVAAFGVALLIGWMPAVLTRPSDSPADLARRSLHFEAFSSSMGIGSVWAHDSNSLRRRS